jgi:hypothetical protein
MRPHVLLILPACWLSVGSAPAAAQQEKPPAPRPVSVTLKDVGLRTAVETLFEAAGVRWRLDREVPNVPITLTLPALPLEDAVRVLVRVGAATVPGLAALKESDGYHVTRTGALVSDPVLPPEPDPRLAKKVTADLKSVPLREALEQLFRGTDAPHVVLPTVPDVAVTARIDDRPVREAIEKVLQVAYGSLPALYFGREGGVYLFGLRSPARQTAGRQKPGAETKGFFNIRGVPLRKTLGYLFQATGLEYLVEESVPDEEVTINFRNVTVEEAARQLVRELGEKVPGLAYTRKDQVFMFRVEK